MSQPLVTLVTTTGHRQKAFELCEKYIKRQTYRGPLEWVVVDDGSKTNPTKCTMDQIYVPGPKEWRPGINTQRLNLDAAIPHIRGEYVYIIEDDDLVKPEYISTYLDFLKYADLVGEGAAIYYNIAVQGYKEMRNYTHASLCQTAFTKKYIPMFDRAVSSGELLIDIRLWSNAIINRHKYIMFHGPLLCVGMKGLPGRGGIGFGHNSQSEFEKDFQFTKLKELLGPDDADVYIKMVQGNKK